MKVILLLGFVVSAYCAGGFHNIDSSKIPDEVLSFARQTLEAKNFVFSDENLRTQITKAEAQVQYTFTFFKLRLNIVAVAWEEYTIYYITPSCS